MTHQKTYQDNNHPNMVVPVVTLLPGQLTALPLFDGERGEAFVNWLKTVEIAKTTYG